MNWYFAVNNSPSNEMADKLIDSKFGIDKLSSFVREIIQNSLDAHDDTLVDAPVFVTFSQKTFTLSEIPGGQRLKKVMENCCNVSSLNHQTREMYQKGISTLGSDIIPCLKISDENTLGVKPGIDEAWGAFVYDEGVSKKTRPGSAGSHGVGKKAPFIISGVHTVYYSTKYNDEKLFEGKTSLVNWRENEIDYDYRGWFGNIFENEPDRRKKVQPISYDFNIDGIDDFFIRKEKNGTDVIIIDSSAIGASDDSKPKIINSILENFFIAILCNKLACDVFGEIIDKTTIDDIINKYYLNQNAAFKKSGDSGRVYDGNLKDYYRVYKNSLPQKIDLTINDVKYGYIDLFFDLKNEKNKKYYCIVREHGMKIRDLKINSDQAFTAVALIRDYEDSPLKPEERINGRLSSRENAAHDDFIIDDEQVPCDPITKELIQLMYSKISEYILKMTELKVENQSFLDSLYDMLEIPGSTATGKVRQNKPKLKKKKKKLLKPGKGVEDDKGDKGTSAGDGGKGTGGKGKKEKIDVGEDVNAYLYTDFNQEPYFLNLGSKYVVRFIPNDDGYVLLNIKPLTADGSDCDINNIIKTAYQNGRPLKIKGNIVKNVKINQGESTTVDIELQPGLDYVLDCDVLKEIKDEK